MSEEVNWWERLRAEREEQGYDQTAFVARVTKLAPGFALTQGTLSSLELGKRPGAKAETLLPIAEALGVSTHWLLTGTGPKFLEGDAPAMSPFEAGRRRFKERAVLLSNPEKVQRFLDDITDDPKRLMGFKAEHNLLQVEGLFEDAFRVWRDQEDLQGAKLPARSAPADNSEYEAEMAKRAADEAKAERMPLAKGAKVKTGQKTST